MIVQSAKKIIAKKRQKEIVSASASQAVSFRRVLT